MEDDEVKVLTPRKRFSSSLRQRMLSHFPAVFALRPLAGSGLREWNSKLLIPKRHSDFWSSRRGFMLQAHTMSIGARWLASSGHLLTPDLIVDQDFVC